MPRGSAPPCYPTPPSPLGFGIQTKQLPLSLRMRSHPPKRGVQGPPSHPRCPPTPFYSQILTAGLFSAQLGRRPHKRTWKWQSAPPHPKPARVRGLAAWEGLPVSSTSGFRGPPCPATPSFAVSCPSLTLPPPRLICVLPLTSKVGSHPVHPTLCSSLSTPPQRRAFGQAGAPGGRGAVQPVCCEGRDFLSNSVLL